ncbi:MAG TPA: ATP-binding protein, partial [Vicinamibacterales bacterium]|nr:ATP-binding protein [Vicinamibacterales bacterium]
VGALVMPWTKHPASGQDLVRRAFDAFYRAGEMAFAGYCFTTSFALSLAVGAPLAEVQAEAERGLAFSRKAQLSVVNGVLSTQLALTRTLRGLTTTFGRLDHEGYDERGTELYLASNRNLGFVECFYWVRKLQARFLAGDYSSAVDAAMNVPRLLWNTPSNFETVEFHLYGALAHAAAHDVASDEQRRKHLEALVGHHRQLEVWAQHNPVTFENCAAIVGAEIARIEGRVLEAQDLYEKGVRSAHDQGFVHNEAIANERAGCFYAARGFEKIAVTYLRDARYCYRRWGADAKVRQLGQIYPQIGVEESIVDATATMQTPVEHLDLATVIKVSEAVSGEIVFERLIDALMRAAIEHAGAERGLLILPRGDEYRIEAEATIGSSDVKVELRQTDVTAAQLPISVLRYAIRTREGVLLHDASGQSSFSDDEYLREHQARSVLCLPILKQTRLLGMLYLENNLTPHAFTPARMAILKLLASGAAISMENARLYRDLAEREAALRGLQTDLAHANRLATMGQLTASISHEINQPIGATRNNAHAALRFLAEDPPDLAEVREAIECVVKETYRAGEILGGIRDQVKKVPPCMEGVRLNEAIEEVTSLVRGELLKHQVSLQMRLTDGLSPVHADRVQLQQVMLNLILNAIDAMISIGDNGRELVISTESIPEGRVLVTVQDSGPGIALESRERIFESFYTTKAGGVGIGLSICRSIVDGHSGRLWVDAHLPRGAAFRFALPAHH